MAQTQINGGTQIRSESITSDRLASGVLTKSAVGLGNVDNTSDANKPVSTATQTALDAKQATSEKGQANGYASLDSGGKVPVSQLPNSIMEYQGVWNASTNTPTLANGTGSPGDVYRVSVGGTSLSLSFAVGDYIIYNGTTWEKSDTTDAVSSVAGRTGDVTLTSTDVGLANVDNTSDSTKNSATATLTNKTISGSSNTLSNIPQSAVTDLGTDLAAKQATSEKGNANGYASLDGTGKVPSSQLPTLFDYSNFVVRETPTGSVNGTNTSYTLGYTPVSGTEQVYLNGILQEPGAGNDYTISSATITYLSAPVTGDKIRVTYMK